MNPMNEQIQLERIVQHLQQSADEGRSLAESERMDAVVLAERVMAENQPQDVSGPDHRAINTFGRLRLLAREVAGSLARNDNEASNPFKEDSLRAVYDAERRFMDFAEKRAASVTLQQLVDRRAELMREVHQTATGMHLAQRREADMYWSVGQQPEASNEYAVAAAFAQEATSIFRQAAGELRRFREDPTRQQGPLAEFRELERLEAEVERTRTSAAATVTAGMDAFADDAAEDAAEAQAAHDRFLREKGVTVPPTPSAAAAKAADNADDCDCSDVRVSSRARAR